MSEKMDALDAQATFPCREDFTELVEEFGLCNYQCKLVSPFLTHYGMDKMGRPKLLRELGHGEVLDCGRILKSRSFCIPKQRIDSLGFGRDKSGSEQYLKDTLDKIIDFNGGAGLIPLHVDGDGHCLVHAISRATTGQELFWHGLQENLYSHLKNYLPKYKNILSDFHDVDEWDMLIHEANPDVAIDGLMEGLGNIHIFALCNVLCRPIVLLDSLKHIENSADYSAIFIPILLDPSECKNPPLCIAWNSSAHNHFVPLVSIENSPELRLPSDVIPRVWGNFPPEKYNQYLDIKEDRSLPVCTGKRTEQSYLKKLVTSMEALFLDKYQVSVGLVCQYYLHNSLQHTPSKLTKIVDMAKQAFMENTYFKCLDCGGITICPLPLEHFRHSGPLLTLLVTCHNPPHPHVLYNFPEYDVKCVYDSQKDCLIPQQSRCKYCGSMNTRHVNKFGEIIFMNGDRTKIPAHQPSCCPYKHFWASHKHLYDNLPRKIHIEIEWEGRKITDTITWFYGDSNKELNSDIIDTTRHWLARKKLSLDNGTLEMYVRKTIMHEIEKLNIYHQNLFEVGDNDQDAIPSCEDINSHDEITCSENATSMEVEPEVTEVKKSDEKESKKVEDTPFSPNQKRKNHLIKIKLSTPYGNTTHEVSPDITVDEIRLLVCALFEVPCERQQLKYDFPPKTITDSQNIKFRNGDKIIVELI